MAERSGDGDRGTTGAVRRTLADGTPVLLTPIGPQDAEGLRHGFARLSAESRTRRFLQPKAALSDAELRYLTAVDQRDHIAWGARDLSLEPPPGLGIARCVRLPEAPDCAEVAVTVIDAYQGRGLGALLLDVLIAAARRQGIERFVAEAAAGNGPALALARRRGAIASRPRDGVVALRLELP